MPFLRCVQLSSFGLALIGLFTPVTARAECNGLSALMGPGPMLVSNPSPTPADIASISDTPIVANIPSDFNLLLRSQPGTYQLFGTWDASCPYQSLAYQFAQQVAKNLTSLQQTNLNTLAVAVAASGVANIASFGFNATINTSQLQSTLQTVATQDFVNQVATAIYTVRFPRAMGQNNTYFFNVLDNPSVAPPYQQYVSAQPYMNQLITELQTGQVNAYHNTQLVTYKLSQMSTNGFNTVSTLYSSNNLPVYPGVWSDLISMQLVADNNFLGNEVSALVNQTNVENHAESRGFGIFVNTQTTTYGPAIQAFVNGPAAQLGLASGAQPSNVSTCLGSGAGGCN